eukprot:TRINITY_DN45349_c0_g1_i1.p1 TRINITY_DN45349_c0_g1~~TRINITY_DN45349_c0_g1_i1.p1  ORF type:complete len:107 (+),score=41.70 TRINITY_DN45349_c0_g1_i1:2-322(+)
MAHHICYTMSALVAVGGVMGYMKGKSQASLAAGLGFGALYAISGYQISQGEMKNGNALALASSVVLAGVMGRRAMKVGMASPAGAVAALGTASAAYSAYKLYQANL